MTAKAAKIAKTAAASGLHLRFWELSPRDSFLLGDLGGLILATSAP